LQLQGGLHSFCFMLAARLPHANSNALPACLPACMCVPITAHPNFNHTPTREQQPKPKQTTTNQTQQNTYQLNVPLQPRALPVPCDTPILSPCKPECSPLRFISAAFTACTCNCNNSGSVHGSRGVGAGVGGIK
jgi:hypothetical protein